MNDKRASRRICANCKQEWTDSAMKRRNKRYICPKCAEATKRIRAIRRHRSKQMGVLEYERASLREVWPEGDGRRHQRKEVRVRSV